MLKTYIIWKCSRRSWGVAEKIIWKTREFRLIFHIRGNVVYNYEEKKKLNQRSSGDYKAGILHDGSSIEAGEASIIPPVDAIWKR